MSDESKVISGIVFGITVVLLVLIVGDYTTTRHAIDKGYCAVMLPGSSGSHWTKCVEGK